MGSPVGVKVLASQHDQIALRFATKLDSKFDDVEWQLEHGAPALVDQHAWIASRASSLITAGDHVLVDVPAAEGSGAPAPFTYWRRAFLDTPRVPSRHRADGEAADRRTCRCVIDVSARVLVDGGGKSWEGQPRLICRTRLRRD